MKSVKQKQTKKNNKIQNRPYLDVIRFIRIGHDGLPFLPPETSQNIIP